MPTTTPQPSWGVPQEPAVFANHPSAGTLAALRAVDVGALQAEVNLLCERLGEAPRYQAHAPLAAECLRADDYATQSNREIQRFNALLAASEERYRTLFDLSPVAIYVIDADGCIQQFNRHAAVLWDKVPRIGDTDHRFCGSHKLFLPDGTFMPHAECPMATVLFGVVGEQRDTEVIIERPNGSRITVIVNIVPLRDAGGAIIGAINCFYDITQRSVMARQIQEQAASLAAQNQQKDEFLAMLSHELRGPLSPITMAVQMLGNENDGSAQQQHARAVISRQTGKLVRLVDDLLEAARITSGKIRLEPRAVSLNAILERAVETTISKVDEKGQTLTMSQPHWPVAVLADADRMEQVLVNLITNAVKYTADGGHITVSLETVGELAQLTVRDSGIGIAPELLPTIFDLFVQEDRSLARSQGGLGIGLSLAKRIVELHGGSIAASSAVGEGSSFVVTLQTTGARALQNGASLAAPATAAGSADAAAAGAQRRVLIVDDNEDAAICQDVLLTMHGYDTRMVHDGRAVLAQALAFRPHAILLDIGLPGLNGYQVAEQIRNEPLLASVLLVAVTGYGLEQDRKRSREAGFDHHVVKPADIDVIKRLLGAVDLAPTA
jgi:signal transduction histidine kinase/ActR/RegA family two-component response regulator